MALNHFTVRKSIFGRLLGISSTGGIVAGPQGSTDVSIAAQMWGPGMFTEATSTDATLSNSGITVVTSGVTSPGGAFTLRAPAKGVSKEIVFNTPSSSLTLNTTSTSILFQTTATFLAANGSTVLTILGSTLGLSGSVVLRGLSATKWALVSKTVAATS